MQLNLAGKTALITGASRGIGFAIAQALHIEGCRIALNSRNEEDLIKAMQKLNDSVIVPGDVSNKKVAVRVAQKAQSLLGGLDIVVCNVGGGRSVLPGNEFPEEWQRMFELNFWSTTNIVESTLDYLQVSKGVILCISSVCGLEVVPNAPLAYSAAKAALNSYVRGVARPLGKKGIRINAIALGNINFENSVWAQKLIENEDSVLEMLEKEVSLNKFGALKDVASLSSYLVSDVANFVTGGIWTLDGGQVR